MSNLSAGYFSAGDLDQALSRATPIVEEAIAAD